MKIREGLHKYHGASFGSLPDMVASSKNLSRSQAIQLNELVALNILVMRCEASDQQQARYTGLCCKLSKRIGLDTYDACVRAIKLYLFFLSAGFAYNLAIDSISSMPLYAKCLTVIVLLGMIFNAVWYRALWLVKIIKAPSKPKPRLRSYSPAGDFEQDDETLNRMESLNRDYADPDHTNPYSMHFH